MAEFVRAQIFGTTFEITSRYVMCFFGVRFGLLVRGALRCDVARVKCSGCDARGTEQR